MLGSVGWVAMATVRPLEDRVPGAVPLLIGADPSAVQLEVLSGIDVDGVVRSSRRSRRKRASARACERWARRGDADRRRTMCELLGGRLAGRRRSPRRRATRHPGAARRVTYA